jgi:hypothetical protein
MRVRLWVVMIGCFFLGAVSIETAHHLPWVLVAAGAAVAGFWLMFALAHWYRHIKL